MTFLQQSSNQPSQNQWVNSWVVRTNAFVCHSDLREQMRPTARFNQDRKYVSGPSDLGRMGQIIQVWWNFSHHDRRVIDVCWTELIVDAAIGSTSSVTCFRLISRNNTTSSSGFKRGRVWSAHSEDMTRALDDLKSSSFSRVYQTGGLNWMRETETPISFRPTCCCFWKHSYDWCWYNLELLRSSRNLPDFIRIPADSICSMLSQFFPSIFGYCRGPWIRSPALGWPTFLTFEREELCWIGMVRIGICPMNDPPWGSLSGNVMFVAFSIIMTILSFVRGSERRY
jgi:hypothetical protein